MNLICRVLGHRKVWRADWETFDGAFPPCEHIAGYSGMGGFFWLTLYCKRCGRRLSIRMCYPMAPRQLA